MLTLDEYLGVLVSNLAHAKVLADLESAKIANMYAKNDILRSFSIPRMKIEDVELTIPVCIEEVLEAARYLDPPVDSASFSSLTYSIILNSVGVTSFNPEISKTLKEEISQHTDNLISKSNKEIAEDLLYEFSMNISKFVHGNWAKLVGKQKNDIIINKNKRSIINKLISDLQTELSKEINLSIDSNPQKKLRVIIESNRIKDKKIDKLLYIKMKITEENLEWERLEDEDGNIIKKLMPY